ncbi:hypothetical protein L484_004518 [Morus notabilis]|uniref:Uncharacterized protein n=1 Tax=Morus notabilis TaxID=981085 RepID=W9QUI3_9ROSA|nr:hypothetical protein L484_004518 [Morus notabilis]
MAQCMAQVDGLACKSKGHDCQHSQCAKWATDKLGKVFRQSQSELAWSFRQAFEIGVGASHVARRLGIGLPISVGERFTGLKERCGTTRRLVGCCPQDARGVLVVGARMSPRLVNTLKRSCKITEKLIFSRVRFDETLPPLVTRSPSPCRLSHCEVRDGNFMASGSATDQTSGQREKVGRKT